jgi:dTDP-4-dehydrorhamnose 3,5-epimerase
LHMLRVDAPWYRKFGEVYFSEIAAGRVKAWKKHLRTTQHFTVPCGRVKFVIYDNRPESSSCGRIVEFEMGRPKHYHLLVVAPNIWYGFKGMGSSPSLVANCTDQPYDPGESENISQTAEVVPYEW